MTSVSRICLPSRLVQVVVAPVVDQGQPEKLVAGGQVHAVDPAQAPGLVAAGGQRPLAGGVQILLLAGQDVGHRQHRHGVAHLALPELLVAAVAVVVDVGGRAAPDRPVGLVAELLPDRRRAWS